MHSYLKLYFSFPGFFLILLRKIKFANIPAFNFSEKRSFFKSVL